MSTADSNRPPEDTPGTPPPGTATFQQPFHKHVGAPASGTAPRGSMRTRGAIFWGELRESLMMAMDAIRAHKLRSSLTLLGVLVGVFSIVVVMTAMRVLQTNIETELSQLGANTFQAQKWPGVYFGGPEGFEKFWRRRNITYEQSRRVQQRAFLARSVGIETDFWGGQATSRYAETPPNVRLIGATEGNFPARNWLVADGRAITPLDVENGRYVAVLGGSLAKTLFPFGSALGESVKLDGINYLVIGVLEAKGEMLGSNQDNFAVIPITTGLNRYGGWNWRSLSILVQAVDQASYEDTVEQVRGILRAIRKVPPGEEDDFELFSNETLIDTFKSVTLSVRVGVAVVSSIALLAAGVGIMNIMLVSVTERTREIGVRRAVGAKKRNVLTQFILEAIVLCQIGGLIGVGLGVITGNVVAYLLKVPPVLPLDWVGLGLLICSIVGIVFGTYPAIKAANLDPIDSLRYE
jgi:putative ABC transport system permease protein